MRVHVIGAGLAGLAASLALADAGLRVALYEAGPAAGGRCRSYFDRQLGARIDNGNHLLLSGNRAAYAYLRRLGTEATLAGPPAPIFPFFDRADGTRWQLRPGRSRLPWWIFAPSRRVPGTSPGDYLALRHVLRARGETRVADLPLAPALALRLITPLAIAALNTMPEIGSASLLGAVVGETLARGGAACIPAFPRDGLSESFIDPALAALAAGGSEIFLARRVTALTTRDGAVGAIATTAGPADFAPGDQVVLAVPPWIAAELLPGLTVPDAFEMILNLHFRLHADPGPAGFWGVIGGVAEWVFVKPGIVSVTISAANRFADTPPETLAEAVWGDVAAVLGVAGAIPPCLPPWRLVRERRATFLASPEQNRRRPGPKSALANLLLAGDWTATGLPATIEGAIRSGNLAAQGIIERVLRHAARH